VNPPFQFIQQGQQCVLLACKIERLAESQLLRHRQGFPSGTDPGFQALIPVAVDSQGPVGAGQFVGGCALDQGFQSLQAPLQHLRGDLQSGPFGQAKAMEGMAGHGQAGAVLFPPPPAAVFVLHLLQSLQSFGNDQGQFFRNGRIRLPGIVRQQGAGMHRRNKARQGLFDAAVGELHQVRNGAVQAGGDAGSKGELQLP